LGFRVGEDSKSDEDTVFAGRALVWKITDVFKILMKT